MEQLKFRVWDTVRQAMYNPQGITFNINNPSPFAVKVSGRPWEPSGKFEFLQWTGLSDDSGTDVYEGDLVEVSSMVYRAVWSDKAAGFELEELENALIRTISDVTLGQVIGNYFESDDYNI